MLAEEMYEGGHYDFMVVAAQTACELLMEGAQSSWLSPVTQLNRSRRSSHVERRNALVHKGAREIPAKGQGHLEALRWARVVEVVMRVVGQRRCRCVPEARAVISPPSVIDGHR